MPDKTQPAPQRDLNKRAQQEAPNVPEATVRATEYTVNLALITRTLTPENPHGH